MTEQQPPPMWRALVVGGEESFVKSRLSQSLAKHNIEIEGHLDWSLRRPPRQLPAGVDLVYICTDMVGHNLSEPCMNMARDVGIPYVNGTRKWAESATRLARAGFPLVTGVEQAHQIEEVKVTESPVEEHKEAAAAVAPEFNSSSSEEEEMSSKSNVQTESNAVPSYREFSYDNPKQRAYVNALLQNPTLSNEELWTAIKDDPALSDCKFDPSRSRAARVALGIRTTSRGAVRVVDVDRDTFTNFAIAVGVNDCKIPEERYEVPTRVSHAHAQRQQDVQPSVQSAPEKALDSGDSDGEPTEGDLISAIRALRDAMKGEGYVELVITQDSVKFKRIQFTEGTITL